MQIAAHAKENTARAGGCQEVFMKFVTSLLKVLHAIGLGEHAPSIEGVNIQFLSWILVTAEKVARQTDASDGQSQAPAHREVNHAQRNGVAGAPINHAVEKAVIRIIIVLLVAAKFMDAK